MRTICHMKKRGVKLERADLTVSRKTFTVDELTLRKLKAVGDGNASLGLRIAARGEYARFQSLPELTAAPATPLKGA